MEQVVPFWWNIANTNIYFICNNMQLMSCCLAHVGVSYIQSFCTSFNHYFIPINSSHLISTPFSCKKPSSLCFISIFHLSRSLSFLSLEEDEDFSTEHEYLWSSSARAVCHVPSPAAGMQGALEDGWKDWQKMTERGRGKISGRRKALEVRRRAKQVKHLSAVWKNSHSLDALSPAREYQRRT